MPVHVAGDRHAGVAEQVGYREGLGAANQQVWPVSSLDVVAGTGSPVVKLFVEHAQAVSSRFSIGNPQEADAVVEICRRLDGISLAIELAASRMASMTASEVRDRLDQRFRLLVGSRRGLAGHQTLRQAVAWSYDHLDDAEKALLDRCSVFSGGFDLESACAVAGSDDHRVRLRMPGRSGPANGCESTADENVPVPGPPLVESNCFTRGRRQAPTGRHANPTLVGGSDDEVAQHQPVPDRSALLRRLGPRSDMADDGED
jgi:hypothetical protein